MIYPAPIVVPTDTLRITMVWADPAATVDTAETARALPAAFTAVLSRRVGQLGMQRDGIAFRIPVHVRWKAWSGEGDSPPRPIALDAAASNLIIIWHDAALVACADTWGKYFSALMAAVEPRDTVDQVLVVRASPDVIQIPALIPLQAIDARGLTGAKDEGDKRFTRLLLRVFSILLAHRRATRSNTPPTSFPIFLSHAKADGEAIALRFVDYQKRSPPAPELGVFFDAESLHAGAAYGKQFSQNIGHGGLIAIESDAYHGRPWCNWELLEAKRLGRPIIVMDVSLSGTGRMFPYIGNVPLVRVPRASASADEDVSDGVIERVLTAFLDEALRINVWKEHARARLGAQGISLETTVVLGRPLELADVAIAASAQPAIEQVIYPDPPLNEHELALVTRAFPGLAVRSLGEFDASGTAGVASSQEWHLRERWIAISISPPPPQDLAALGRLPGDLNAAMDAIFTPLVQAGANISYGGRIGADPRLGPEVNFTLLLARDLAAAYRILGAERPRPFRHYARHGELAIRTPQDLFEHTRSLGTAADVLITASGRRVGLLRAHEEVLSFQLDGSARRILIESAEALAALDDLRQLFAARPDPEADLRQMRRFMTQDAAARLLVGGSCAPGLSGRSGVAQEALFTIEANKPLLIVGAFGGASRDIAIALGLLDESGAALARSDRSYTNARQNVREAYWQSVAELAGVRERYQAQLQTWGLGSLARELAATESPYAQSVLVHAALRRALNPMRDG